MRNRLAACLAAILTATGLQVVVLAAAAPAARAADPLPLPAYDAAAVANPPGTASAGTVPMGGTEGSFGVSDVGTASYTVPLRVVPGRGGLQPRLSLRYSSQSGDGQLGTGFSLSGLSQITRCDRTVAEDGLADGVSLGEDDRFCLDGQKLVAVTGTYGADGTEYRTRVDSHVRVRSYRTAGASGRGPTHFVVWGADGLVHDYGTGGDSVRVGAGAIGDFARIAWPVKRTADRSGNVIEYTYGTTKTVTNDETERWPATILYGRPGQLDRKVEFTVATRPDVRHGFLHGHERVSTKLVTSVTMFAKPGTGWERARSYALTYETSTGDSGASRLSRVKECGRSLGECLRPTELSWSAGLAGFQDGAPQTSTGLPLVPTSPESIITAADFSGDGRTDLAWPEQTTWRYAFSESGGYRSAADRITIPNTGFTKTSFPFDYDLDGRVDIMPRNPQINTYSPVLSRGTQPFVRATTPFLGGFNQVTAGNQVAGGMTGDFDGDGYEDVLEFQKPLGNSTDDFPIKWSWRHRTGTVDSTVDAAQPSDASAFGPQVQLPALLGLTPNKVLVTDANGDGRDEIIYPTNNSAVSLDPLGRVQPFTYGSIRNALMQLDVKAADVNGDGLPDLLTNGDEHNAKSHKLYVHLNTGRLFTAPKEIGTTGSELAASLVVDDDGDGRDDLLVPRHNATDKYYAMDVVHFGASATGALTLSVSPTTVTYAHRTLAELGPQGPRLADVDGDGRSDVVVVNRGAEPGMEVFRHSSGAAGTAHADLLTGVKEGTQAQSGTAVLPATVTVLYATLTESGTYQPGACPRTPQLMCLRTGLRAVVSEVRRDSGGSAARTARYTYVNGRVDKASRAFLGFAERKVVEDVAGGGHGAVTTRTFYSNTTRLDPRPTEEWSFATLPGGTQALRRTTFEWAEKQTAGGASFGYVAAERVRRYELPPPAFPAVWSPAQLDSTNPQPYAGTLDRTTDIDQFGNVLARSTQEFGADQTQPQTNTLVSSSPDVDLPNWLVRRTRSVQTVDQVRRDGGWAGASRTAESEFLPGSTLVTRNRSFGTPAGRVLATELGYDAAGNLVRSGLVDETSGERRETTFAYDPMGYPHAAMNALGHVSRTGFDPVSGLLEVMVDPNKLRTEHTFDSLGRPVRTRLPSGAETTTAYALETSGAELLRRTEVRDGTGAVTQVVTDRLGRPVVERFRGFDGAMRQSTSASGPSRTASAAPPARAARPTATPTSAACCPRRTRAAPSARWRTPGCPPPPPTRAAGAARTSGTRAGRSCGWSTGSARRSRWPGPTGTCRSACWTGPRPRGWPAARRPSGTTARGCSCPRPTRRAARGRRRTTPSARCRPLWTPPVAGPCWSTTRSAGSPAARSTRAGCSAACWSTGTTATGTAAGSGCCCRAASPTVPRRRAPSSSTTR